MVDLVKVNKKVINDPLYTPVKKFLEERIAKLEINDPNGELPLALERYTGIVAGDLVLENAVSFPDGAVRACFCARKEGFARVDVDIVQVPMKDIIEDFAVPMTVINTVDDIKDFAKANTEPYVLLWLDYLQTYGVMLTQNSAKTHEGAQNAFGNLFFQSYIISRETLTSIDPETYESGTLQIDDPSMGSATYPVFINELVVIEANLPEITSNLPPELITRRGDVWQIPNTYWFGGTEDITLTATVELSTNSGYTIPERSPNLLFIDGETIFGSATQDMQDEITVRVSYPYQDRVIYKRFKIKVKILKDEVEDLVVVCNPAEIEAIYGDEIEVTLTASFRDNVVEILIPPASLKSAIFGGNPLTLIRTNADYSMVYRGVINTSLGGRDQIYNSYSGEFTYTESGGVYKATGFVTVKQVKPATRPALTVTGVPTLISGYKGDKGSYNPVIKYGTEVLTLEQAGVTGGIKGTRRLIDLYDVNQITGVDWELIENSGITGTPITDNFTQRYSYVNPWGVLLKVDKVIQVEVKLNSLVSIVPSGDQPRTVKRYESGGPTFAIMINGVDRTSQMLTMRIVDQDEPYFKIAPSYPKRWQVLNTAEEQITHNVEFEFTVRVDGEIKTYRYTQEFIILPWIPGTGENSDIVIVPESATINGQSDEGGTYQLKVFRDGVDITADSRILTDKTVLPERTRFTKLEYDAENNWFELDYYLDGKSESVGYVYATKKDIAEPTDSQLGRFTLITNVTQKRVLKLISAPALTDLDIDVPKNVPIVLEYNGEPIAINDPRLKYLKDNATDTQILGPTNTGLNLSDTFWRNDGGIYTETMIVIATYTDPDDGAKLELKFNLPLRITIPNVIMVQDQNTINTKIWEKGTFPFRLMGGTKDWTSAITRTELLTGSKYVKANKLDWEVYNAESTPVSTIVGIRYYYTIGYSSGKSGTVEFRFNIEAWNGITFAVDSYSPTVINGKAGDTGEIKATLVYKGQDATQASIWDKTKSTIPETFEFGTDVYRDGQRVFPYTLKRGGSYPLTLAFVAPTPGTETASLSIQTTVDWAKDLNIVSSGDKIEGFWNNNLVYPLVLNFSGTPVALDNPNLTISFDSGTGNPVEYKGTQIDGLKVHLAKGGLLDTSYDYPTLIKLTYTDPTTQVIYSKEINIVSTIKISKIIITNNPVINAQVYEKGRIGVILTDEEGTELPLEGINQRGQGVNVSLVNILYWYVTNGSTTGTTTGTLPLLMSVYYAGESQLVSVDIRFNIAQWSGAKFSVTVDPTSLNGNAGQSGTLKFTITYMGEPVVNAIWDGSRSVLPRNLAVGDLDRVNYTLPYTLLGQGVDTAKFVFIHPDAGADPVEGVNMGTVSVPVKTVSTDEIFSVVNYTRRSEFNWGTNGLFAATFMYGGFEVPSDSPALKYVLRDADPQGLKFVRALKNGFNMTSNKSSTAGSVDEWPGTLDVTYEVGAPTPKKVTLDIIGVVSMNDPAIGNNDETPVKIWDKKSLPQTVKFNDVVLNGIDHFEIKAGSNKYIEMTGPKAYEVVGAESVKTTTVIPMIVYYKVDTTSVLQKLEFDLTLVIDASNDVWFKVVPTPPSIDVALDVELAVRFRPVFKGQEVGSQATFKPEQMVIPPQITLKEYHVDGLDYVFTFVGKAKGISKAKFVFWSPNAGTAPAARDIWTGELPVQVMGELGLEIGTRDNLLVGKDNDTGNYKLQVLFGGIPFDVAQAIEDGIFTATVEVGALTSMNANVLNITEWEAESFDYKLNGIVVPNQTANVSDFINLTYKYGAQTYTRRVEIPLSYTTPAPTITNVDHLDPGVNVFDTGAVVPVIKLGDVDISSGFATINNNGANTYVSYSANKYSIDWGETTDTIQTVSARFVGQYRNWPWSLIQDVKYKILAWDQRTFNPTITPTSGSNYSGDTLTIAVKAEYKKQYLYLNNGYDASRSDLKGMGTLVYVNTTGSGNNRVDNYRFTSGTKIGKETLKLCWLRPGAPTPGTENNDYAFTDFEIEVKERVLTGSGGPINGISGATGVNAPLVVRITPTTNIPINDANLKITPENEDIFKITSRTATAMILEITASYKLADTSQKTTLNFEYTQANGLIAKGSYDYVINVKTPADFPVAKIKGPLYGSAIWNPQPKLQALWSYGPNPYTVTLGNGGIDVTDQCELVSFVHDTLDTNSGIQEIIESKNLPVEGTWWWVTNARDGSDQARRNVNVKMKVPYKGDFIELDLNYNWIVPTVQLSNTAVRNAFRVSTTSTDISANTGDEFEIPFTILWRAYKYGEAVIKPTVKNTASASLSEVATVTGQRYDDASGITYLKIKMTKGYAGTVDFVFDHKDAGNNPVVGDTLANRGAATINFSAITVVPVLSPVIMNMWDFRYISEIFKVMNGTTDITNQITLTSVSTPLLAIAVANNASTGPRIRASSTTATPAFDATVKFTFNLGSNFANAIMTYDVRVTISEYDGIEFTFEKSITTVQKVPIGAGNNSDVTQPGFYKFRGVDLGSVGITTGDFASMNDGNANFKAGQAFNGGYRFIATAAKVFNGKLKYPTRFIGTGSTDYPAGTLGKNYLISESDVVFYQNALFFYPTSESTPEPISGKAGDTNVQSKFKLSVGEGIDENQVLPSATGMTTAIVTPANWNNIVTLAGKNSEGGLFNIIYKNYGTEDVTVDIPMTQRYAATYKGVAVNSTISYSQRVIIKPTTGSNTITSSQVPQGGAVWGVGGRCVNITLDGVNVPDANITDVEIVPNQYVARPETTPNTTTRWYQIINGEPTSKVTMVTFKVTFTDGVKQFTVTQDVQFTIDAYDGVDIKYNLAGLNSFNNGLTTTPSGNVTFSMFLVSHRGRTLTAAGDFNTGLYGIWQTKTTVPGYKTPYVRSTGNVDNQRGNQLSTVYQAGTEDMQASIDGKVYFGIMAKENDPSAVLNKDYVIINMPCYVYNNSKYYPVSGPDVYTGKFNDAQAKLAFRIRQGITSRTLNYTGVAPTLENPGNLELVLGLSDQATNATVFFNKELTNKPQQVLDSVFTFGPADESLRARFPVKVTQNSNYAFPTITDVQSVTAQLNDTGGIPFKLMNGSTDVTSTATIQSLSQNDYIDLYNGQWRCFNTRTGDTNVTITFIVALTYQGNAITMEQKVDFVVKGFSGEPTVSDVQTVNGSVWDQGDELPFTINISGNPVPLAWIKSNTGVAQNGRVTVGPAIGAWRIIAGDQTQSVIERVTYTVVVSNGLREWTVTQEVQFNIAQYDGIDFKLQLLNQGAGNTALNSGVILLPSTAPVEISFGGTYQGIPVSTLTSVSATTEVPLEITQTYNRGSSVAYGIQAPTAGSDPSIQQLTVKLSRDGNPTQIEGNNVASLTIPVVLTVDGLLVINSQTTTEISGKLGLTPAVDLFVFKAKSPVTDIELIDLTNPESTFTFDPTGVIEMVPGSLTPTGFRVQFLSDVDVTTVTDVFINGNVGGGAVNWNVAVTQVTAKLPPAITDVQSVSAKLNQSGELPFTIIGQGNQDITDQATITSLSNSEYIKLVNGKWSCVNAMTSDVQETVEFTVQVVDQGVTWTLKQNVDFTVLSWNGRPLTATANAVTTRIDDTDAIIVQGSSGPSNLAYNVTLDLEASDGKGLVELGELSNNANGTVSISIVGIGLGEGDITLRLNNVIQSGNNNEGSDFIVIEVNVTVGYGTLVMSSGFQGYGEGDKDNSVTLIQNVQIPA